jgi:5-methylcytosine-specific restriction protein B
MIAYKKYEKHVFEWLMSKHNNDISFTFSVRQKASKGAESDYFIGTEKSKYFATTFWSIPVSFAGSSGDCIDLIFQYTLTGISYLFEFTQTMSPKKGQNTYVLNLVKSLKNEIDSKIGIQRESTIKNKMFTIRTKSRKPNYSDLNEMFEDISLDLKIIIPLVEKHIEIEKSKHADFEAKRITKEDFDSMIKKMHYRFEKYGNMLSNSSKDAGSIGSNLKNNTNKPKFPLNQILFGPPGTGKTYHTINKALSIIENKSEEELRLEDRKELKKRFDRCLNTGQIVFSTFHQSMTYEDFIEGIKPIVEENENENKQVLYIVVDGIFKQIVESAKKERTESKEIIEDYNFDDAWNDLVDESKKQLEENTPLQLSIQTPHLGLKVVEVTDKGNLKLKPIYSEQAKEYLVSFDRAKKLQNVFSDLSVVKNIDKEFRAVIGGSNSTAYWSVLNYINSKINSNKKSIITEVKSKKVPHVLIIDEINRGNVSQIFGELITLIEEDKRLGKDEALEVTLPYSKEKFGVPENLYIIGTMNTADRSVEALDTALRRRFTFEEMPPKYDLKDLNYKISDYDAFAILQTINTRIEKLIDKDHAVGHSYFLNKNNESIVDSFYKNIIPLLQEYFFGDYGKMGLVLGKGFVRLKENEKGTSVFADFDIQTAQDLDDREVYEIIDYRVTTAYKLKINKIELEMDFNKAIQVLMNKKFE